jgi:addiction module HigA family antidote
MTTKASRQLHSDLPIPPGELLAEELATVGITQQEFSDRSGLAIGLVEGIISGNAAISDRTARTLETALGVPASLWLNLERAYVVTRAKAERRAARTSGER